MHNCMLMICTFSGFVPTINIQIMYFIRCIYIHSLTTLWNGHFIFISCIHCRYIFKYPIWISWITNNVAFNKSLILSSVDCDRRIILWRRYCILYTKCELFHFLFSNSSYFFHIRGSCSSIVMHEHDYFQIQFKKCSNQSENKLVKNAAY